MHAIPRALFGQRAANMSLFQTILQEPPVPPAVPEDWTLTVRVFQGTGAAVVHTIVHPFKIAKTPAGGIAADTAQMTADNGWLNGPIGTAGTLLHHMNSKGGHYARVALGVSGGALKVRACFMRSDSADQVTAITGAAAVSSKVAYAMGAVDPLGTAAGPSSAGKGERQLERIGHRGPAPDWSPCRPVCRSPRRDRLASRRRSARRTTGFPSGPEGRSGCVPKACESARGTPGSGPRGRRSRHGSGC